ncbi:MAG: PaaI family thioesterase [Bradyrhizobium sp.]|uniref:PaaI family thioesterase n=1 Tax=Bradyrhizobium sp. TaxID=376 RepID=UPI0029AA434B|nr:PaaI family thioesterase [Bradyrhizobium sp.]MDX3969198.1 PaaI family thioesterase [Bradyrhizobium sp.]
MAMAMDDVGFFAKILSGEFPQAPITKLLGWKFLDFDAAAQVIRVEMQARPEFINPAGVIHGGMLAAMLDETLSPALAATLGPGEFAPTLEIKVNFISPAKLGRVLGTGRIVSRGRSICFMEGQLHDEQGNLLATASATSKIGRKGNP